MRSNFTVVAAVAFFVLTPSVADPSAAGGDTSTNVPATTPGEENKGKPVVSPPDTAAAEGRGKQHERPHYLSRRGEQGQTTRL